MGNPKPRAAPSPPAPDSSLMKRFVSWGRWSRVTQCQERSSVASGCLFIMMIIILWYAQLPGGVNDCWLPSWECLRAAADLAFP